MMLNAKGSVGFGPDWRNQQVTNPIAGEKPETLKGDGIFLFSFYFSLGSCGRCNAVEIQ